DRGGAYPPAARRDRSTARDWTPLAPAEFRDHASESARASTPAFAPRMTATHRAAAAPTMMTTQVIRSTVKPVLRMPFRRVASARAHGKYVTQISRTAAVMLVLATKAAGRRATGA